MPYIQKTNYNLAIFCLSFSQFLLISSVSFAQPKPTIVPVNPEGVPFSTKMQEWGFTIVNCQNNTSQIQYQNTLVCVRPTNEMPAGFYIYDSAKNEIRPANTNTNQLYQKTTDSSLSKTNESSSNSAALAGIFTFTNLYDYSSCIDDILRLHLGELKRQDNQITLIYGNFMRVHEKKSDCIDKVIDIYGNRQINSSEVYQLLDLANFRATRLLAGRLYPPLGIRRRAAQFIGFVYEMDRNNPEILKLTNSPQMIKDEGILK